MSRYFEQDGRVPRHRLTNTRTLSVSLCNLEEDLAEAFQAVQDDIDAGPGGSGILVLDFSAAAEWVVNHNLGRAVSVEVQNTGGSRIGADVQQVSLNQVRVRFEVPVSGRVIVR